MKTTKLSNRLTKVGMTIGTAALAATTPILTATENDTSVKYQSTEIEGQKIFYREAGPKDAPTILLLHGFPTSSHMFRNLIPQLADKYHVVAPDYPGFGNSSIPMVDEFEYTFDTLLKSLTNSLKSLV